MRDLMKYANKCMDMLDEINIPYHKPKSWRVSGRMTNTFGTYHSGKKEVAISKKLLDERLPEDMLENTIIHELIHSCDGCQNHGPNFHRYGDKVNRELGYKIATYVSKSEAETMRNYYKPKERKYIVYCPNCGHEWKYKVQGRVYKYPYMYRCGLCQVHLKRKDDIELTSATKLN